MAINDPLTTEEMFYRTRAQDEPQIPVSQIQAGAGFSQEQLQSTATQMNRERFAANDEAMQTNMQAMVQLEQLRAQRAAEAEQRQVVIQTRAAEIARVTYEREREVNRPAQQEAARIAANRLTEEMGQMGRKGGFRQYDPVMRTFREGRPSGFDESMAGRITEIKQAAGIGPMGQRVVTPYFETEQYTGRAGRRPEEPRMTGDDILSTQSAPMDRRMRDAISSSPGGQIALSRYEGQVATVLGKMRNELVNLTDEFGMVEPKALAEFAASLPEFTPAMAPDVKRAIGAIGATVNQNALNVAKFKQDLVEFEASKREGLIKADAATLSTFGQAAQMFQRPETMPPETARLLEGGMTPSEVVLRTSRQQTVDPIAEANYRDANIRRTARFLLGEDADLDAAGTMAGDIEDDGAVSQIVEENLASVYDEVRTGGGDIRANMTTILAQRANLAGVEPAEAMFRLGEIWDRVNEYTGQRLEETATTIRSEQTAAARVDIENAAARIASNAAQFSPTAFQETFKTESFKQAGTDAGRQSLALGGAFIEMLRADTEQMFSVADPRQIADLQATYDEYLGALGTPREQELAERDEDFARIVAARDVYVEAGLIQAKSNQSDLELSTREAMISRQQRASMTGIDNYTTVSIGNAAYNIPVTNRDESGNPVIDSGLARTLSVYPDNWYVQEVINNNRQGQFITEAGVAELSRINEAPTEAIKTLYDENIQRNVARNVATMLPDNPVRQIIQSTDLAAIPSMSGGAYSEEEYASKVVPMMEVAQTIPSGRAEVDGVVRSVGVEVNLSAKLNEINTANVQSFGGKLPDGATPISEIIRSTPLLRDMYYNGRTQESRQRAVAAAYVEQRRSIQQAAINVVVGTVNPVDRKQTGLSMMSAIGEAYAGAGPEATQQTVMDDIRGMEATLRRSSFSQISNVYDAQIEAMAGRYNIDSLERLVEDYDNRMGKLKSTYGEQYGELAGVDSASMKIMTDWAGVSSEQGYAIAQETIDNAREIVKAYRDLVDYRNSRRAGVRTQGRAIAPQFQ